MEYYCDNYLKNAQLKCNRDGSFKYFLNNLKIMKILTSELDSKVEFEAYIGFFKEEEIKEIVKDVDRLLIHDYVRDPNDLFYYVKKRLTILDKLKSEVKVSILYSSEMDFLGRYYRKHDFHEVERLFWDQLEKDNITLKEHLNFEGMTYYNYNYFKYATGFFENKYEKK